MRDSMPYHVQPSCQNCLVSCFYKDSSVCGVIYTIGIIISQDQSTTLGNGIIKDLGLVSLDLEGCFLGLHILW